jgi:HK97 family phage portal protein
MGLGRLLTRSTRYTATDTVTGASATYVVLDNLAPDFISSGSYRGAMSIPGAWRAAVLLSDLLGQVPWHAYRQFAGRPEELLAPNPPLLEQPAPPDTRMTTFSSWGLDLIWHGNAVGVVAARSPFGWPTAVVPVPAMNVGVRRVTRFVDSPLPVGALEYSIGSMRLGSQDVIHIKGPCEPGAVRGMGVLEAHLNTLNLAQEQSKQARSVSNHGVPTGILKSDNPDLTDDEAADLKAGWLASQSSRTVAVLNASTNFTPLAWNPEQLQLVEARKFTLTELELIFGLPVGWLGGMNSARQYSNIEMDAVNLIKFSLGGHLGRFEQTLTLAFPRGTQARANLDAVLRADTLTRYQAHAIALDKEFLTVDEVRELEHRAPLPAVESGEAGQAQARAIAEVIQKIYPGVGVLITDDEARVIVNRAGAGLTPGPLPTVNGAANGARTLADLVPLNGRKP